MSAAEPSLHAQVAHDTAGIYDDDALEVLFDEDFAEGTDLHGRARGRAGGMLPATELLNLSKPQAVAAKGVLLGKHATGNWHRLLNQRHSHSYCISL